MSYATWLQVTLLTTVASVAAGVVSAAEDHSAHQHQHGEAAQQSSQQGHAGHEMPASHQGHHAQHAPATSDVPTESERAHVPPPPPQHVMGEMSQERMNELMQMDDAALVGMVLIDKLEWSEIDGADALHWGGDAWYGSDYNKAWFKAEGGRVDGETQMRAELLWDRIVRRWWSAQAGVRHDFGEGPERTWAAFGVQGLAAYWFEVEATLYVGEEGRTAARFSGEYELLLTQRLILQPELEFELYGKDDPQNGIGSGLSDAEIALRLRYEVRREFAPYVGIAWSRQFGNTADLTRAAGRDVSDLQFVAGLRVWF